ncbi:MAG: EF-hand domain-containing protein [Bradyrhizobium sp.]|uniref:EF-hand domain-containing protein n=1 Tax=Bradyrhizobium sp. TaxID=376 RepID=UPI001DF37860|nr:EF-hand domain-containing protein [Bradyrhizobium sp.]MBV9564514.1 EF-hand domain-containing protein [Bradyrhizobium sp.]
MLMALGAVSTIWESLQALTATKASQSTGVGQAATNPFDLGNASTPPATSTAPSGGTGGAPQISAQTMGALLDAQSQAGAASTSTSTSSSAQSPDASLQDLFSLIDGDGNGQISKSEFESALGAGGTNVAAADKVFGELDSNGDGSVSLDEMKNALQGAGGHHGHHHAHAVSGSDNTGSTDATSDTGATDPMIAALMAALDSSSSSSAASSGSSTADNSATAPVNGLEQVSATLTQGPGSSVTPIPSSAYSYVQFDQMMQHAQNFAAAPLSLSV